MIPFFFFGFFDHSEETSPEEIKTSAKASHKFIKRGFDIIKRNNETTQYVDDSLLIKPKPKSKQKQQVKAEKNTEYTYKPYSNGFIDAIENGHLKAQVIIKSMTEKSNKAKALKKAELQRLQDQEDEAILMMMFEMM